MKKILIVVFSFFIMSFVSAQRYSLGLMASPDFTYINGSFSKNNIGASHTTVPGYTIGISIHKKISKHFFGTTGLWYINKGTKTFKTFIYLDPNSIPIDTLPGTSTHKYQDLDIPLLINYKTGGTKLQFTCSLGLVLGFALKETITDASSYKTTVNNAKTYRTGPDRINLNLGVGAMYRFNDKYSIMIEPNYKIDLKAIAQSTHDNSHSFGIRTTLIYKFKY